MHGCQGVCMVARGHAWLLGVVRGCQGVCVVAGGCGCFGVCMVAGGHVWLQGACVVVGGGRA